MTLPHLSQSQAVKMHQESMRKEAVTLNRSTMTAEELELWEHTYENRLGELCGTSTPTPEQKQYAEDEAVLAVAWYRETPGILAGRREREGRE